MTIEELEQIAESTRAEYAKYDHEINVCMGTGCMGLCAAGPLVLVDPEETLYQHVKAENAKQVVAHLGGTPVAELQCNLREHFDQQVHVVLENSGHIDPEKIDDYIARDGYRALVKALT